MRLSYNAPISLTFSLFAIAVMACDKWLSPGIISNVFTAEGSTTFVFSRPEGYLRLLTYVFGHRDWNHLLNNLTFILLLGAGLEEKYGSPSVFFMILVTTALNGLINVFFFPSRLMGASGIVFMMILLSSFGNIKRREFPITFFLVAALYLWRELSSAFSSKDVSEISHLIGGFCGGVFGFFESVIKGRSANKRDRADADRYRQPPSDY